jgi:hypothetical protein
MPYFLVSGVALVGAWFMLKDVPGGIAERYTPNSFKFKPWDLA